MMRPSCSVIEQNVQPPKQPRVIDDREADHLVGRNVRTPVGPGAAGACRAARRSRPSRAVVSGIGGGLSHTSLSPCRCTRRARVAGIAFRCRMRDACAYNDGIGPHLLVRRHADDAAFAGCVGDFARMALMSSCAYRRGSSCARGTRISSAADAAVVRRSAWRRRSVDALSVLPCRPPAASHALALNLHRIRIDRRIHADQACRRAWSRSQYQSAREHVARERGTTDICHARQSACRRRADARSRQIWRSALP